MLKSPIIILQYFKMALLNDSDSYSKRIERLPGSGGSAHTKTKPSTFSYCKFRANTLRKT